MDDRARSRRTMKAVARVVYLASRYPAPSHTFILREVQALRNLGYSVDTITLRRPPSADLLSAQDRDESARTWTVLPVRPWVALWAVIATTARHPAAMAGLFVLSQRQGSTTARARLWRIFYLAEAILVHRHCRRLGVRHLHAHFANVAADVAWFTAELGRRIDGADTWAWSFTMHGPTELYDVERYGLAEKATAADLVICISDFARSQLMRLAPPACWGRFHVVHCGVDPEAFPLVGRRVDGGPTTVLHVGRLVPDKGLPVLLDALALLRARGEDLRLVVVGDGPDAEAFRRHAELVGVADLVRWDGAVGQHEMLERYHEADLFCLPSFAEGLPVVLMEAMSTGLAVVTTGVAAVSELVVDGEHGRVVSPGRPDLLADALAELSRRPDERARMGAAGRCVVEQSFDVRRSAREIAALFSDLPHRAEKASNRRTSVPTAVLPPPPSAPTPRVSVIIPAHNEAGVIERCLRQLDPDARRDLLEAIVVCNGCRDDTAQRARAVSSHVRVAEIPEASKWRALRLGDRLARAGPRVYLDADTVLSPGAIAEVAAVLERPGPVVAAPSIRFEVEGLSWPMRRFVEVWRQHPYFTDRPVGSGFYAMSPEGRGRFGEFPPIIADDLFARALFADEERVSVDSASFTPLLPRRVRDMVKVHVRHHEGNEELRRWATETGTPLPALSARSATWLRDTLRRPGQWIGVILYLWVKVASRGLAVRRAGRSGGRWHRDERSRAGA